MSMNIRLQKTDAEKAKENETLEQIQAVMGPDSSLGIMDILLKTITDVLSKSGLDVFHDPDDASRCYAKDIRPIEMDNWTFKTIANIVGHNGKLSRIWDAARHYDIAISFAAYKPGIAYYSVQVPTSPKSQFGINISKTNFIALMTQLELPHDDHETTGGTYSVGILQTALDLYGHKTMFPTNDDIVRLYYSKLQRLINHATTLGVAKIEAF